MEVSDDKYGNKILETAFENKKVRILPKIDFNRLSVEGPILQDIGFHEVSHLVDNLGDKAISSGSITKFWEGKISNSGFFTQLNESNFFEDRNFGGHSRDNPQELFASFVVSLRHPNWEDRIED